MATLLIEHDIQNYDQWRAAFDSHVDVRNKHNLSNERIYCTPGTQTGIIGVFEGTPGDLNAFINDPTLKEAMGKAGVVGAPRFTMLDSLEATV